MNHPEAAEVCLIHIQDRAPVEKVVLVTVAEAEAVAMEGATGEVMAVATEVRSEES